MLRCFGPDCAVKKNQNWEFFITASWIPMGNTVDWRCIGLSANVLINGSFFRRGTRFRWVSQYFYDLGHILLPMCTIKRPSDTGGRSRIRSGRAGSATEIDRIHL